MKRQHLTVGLVLACMLCTSVQSKVPITHDMRVRAGDRVGARVSLLMSLEMDERQRKTMLMRDYRIMKKYGVNHSEPELFKEVEAYLNLVSKTADRLADTTMKEMVRGGQSALEYGKTLIDAAETFSDRIDVAGRTSVSQRRLESLESFLKDDASRTPAQAEHIQRVVAVHKKIGALFSREAVLQGMKNDFTSAMESVYQTKTAGIDAEISFRMFDLLLSPKLHSEQSIEDVLNASGFLDRYQARYGQTLWGSFEHSELAQPYARWVDVIATSDAVVPHVGLLASFAMERTKENIKNEAAWVQSKHALVEKAAEAATVLTDLGVELDPQMTVRPAYIAKECSRHSQAAPEVSALHAEIQALITAYDMMVRSQADLRAVSYLNKDRAALSDIDQEIIAADIPEVAVAAPMEDIVLETGEESSRLLKWLPPVFALGVGVTWHLLGKKAHEKARTTKRLNTFWSFFNSVGTPYEYAQDRIAAAKLKWAQFRNRSHSTASQVATGVVAPVAVPPVRIPVVAAPAPAAPPIIRVAPAAPVSVQKVSTAIQTEMPADPAKIPATVKTEAPPVRMLVPADPPPAILTPTLPITPPREQLPAAPAEEAVKPAAPAVTPVEAEVKAGPPLVPPVTQADVNVGMGAALKSLTKPGKTSQYVPGSRPFDEIIRLRGEEERTQDPQAGFRDMVSEKMRANRHLIGGRGVAKRAWSNVQPRQLVSTKRSPYERQDLVSRMHRVPL